MEWPKLKNIILLLLVTTNLCLVGLLIHQGWLGRHQEQEARSHAMAFLTQKNVTVAPNQIPKSMTLAPQMVERNRAAEQAAAQALLGQHVTEEHLGGEVYRYCGSAGWIQFHSDGAFSAAFEMGQFPLDSDPEQAGLALLAKLDYQGQLLQQERDYLTFCQTWEEVPIFNQQVTLTCAEGSITGLTGGRRLTGTPTPSEFSTPLSVATALFDFYNGLGLLGDVCSHVDQIEQGYISTAALTGPMTLTPVWRIDTDTGRYQLDTVTGVLNRLS